MRKRSKSREYILQILYQIEMSEESTDIILKRFWQDKSSSLEAVNFANEIVIGTIQNLVEIDNLISKYSKNWKIDRISTIDHNILRSAIYEILYRNDIPPKVAINEALELANKFSVPESKKFINGILDAIMNMPESL